MLRPCDCPTTSGCCGNTEVNLLVRTGVERLTGIRPCYVGLALLRHTASAHMTGLVFVYFVKGTANGRLAVSDHSSTIYMLRKASSTINRIDCSLHTPNHVLYTFPTHNLASSILLEAGPTCDLENPTLALKTPHGRPRTRKKQNNKRRYLHVPYPVYSIQRQSTD